MHRLFLYHRRWDTFRQPRQDALDHRFLCGLQRDQRLGARIVEPTNERKGGAVVLEDECRAGDGPALLQRFCDLEFQRNGPVDVEELALLAERIEKVTEILERHGGSPLLIPNKPKARQTS